MLELIPLPRDALPLPRLARTPALVAQQLPQHGQTRLAQTERVARARAQLRRHLVRVKGEG